MSVTVGCVRNYGKSELKKIIESCGCCPPMEPQCPPIYTSCPPESSIICCPPAPCCPRPKPCMPCPPCPPCPPPMPCSPRPCTLLCPPRPPCLGYPCITFASLPQPVPAPYDFGPVQRTPITTGGLFYTGTIRGIYFISIMNHPERWNRQLCTLCPRARGHVDRSSCTITTCMGPLFSSERHKTCQPYYPKIQPIKAVKFRQPVNVPKGYGPWTNLTYHPVIQGGFRYFGVQKLVPLCPPPSSPILARVVAVKPTDHPDLVVYPAPEL